MIQGHFTKRQNNLQHQIFFNINYSIQMQNLMKNLILLSNVTWMYHLTELRAFKDPPGPDMNPQGRTCVMFEDM